MNANSDLTAMKRPASDGDGIAQPPSSKRMKREGNDDEIKRDLKEEKPKRWIAHERCEDYMECVGNLMYPTMKLAPHHLLERVTSLGYFTSKLRRPAVWETWSPHDICIFEGCLQAHGKNFYKVTKYLPHKTTKDVVAFYYVWKKTARYKAWKKEYAAENNAWMTAALATTTMPTTTSASSKKK